MGRASPVIYWVKKEEAGWHSALLPPLYKFHIKVL